MNGHKQDARLPALHGIIERYNISASSGASLISDIPYKKPIDGSTFPGAIRFLGEST